MAGVIVLVLSSVGHSDTTRGRLTLADLAGSLCLREMCEE